MSSILLIAFGAFAASYLLQWSIIKLSYRYNIFIDSHMDDKPQNFHDNATPRAGGIGIMVSMLFLLLTPIGWKLLFSFLLAFLSGIFEDLHRSLQPKVRLILQFVAASSAVILTSSVITYFGFDFTVSYDIGILLSILGIMGMMNAINMIDGFNGLASGMVLLMLIAFGTIAYRVGDSDIVYISIITISSLLAFLIFNFPQGKIFLGDGGSYLLGFIVAVMGIFLASNYMKVSPWFVLAVLIYPSWEVIFSIIRKLLLRRSPLEPDSLHLHMLIYKHFTKSNHLTSLVIVSATSPFMLMPILYANNSTANFLTSLLYIILYTALYRYLYLRYEK
ncbi:Undecaprenyl-phosphate N-acetylglucosaminyl 1-phosphate transferase [hydrothermal vent metagenome]|uniref:Undecaprenyl-phosphate N-acetylglucosaminyl 1-phosphate transferase n=1 Tax=hydrothermal vent metagenome TaxID=652676 RepID=A0A1W1BUX0_9ZZZZ